MAGFIVTNFFRFVPSCLLLWGLFSQALALEPLHIEHTTIDHHPRIQISESLSVDEVLQAALSRAPQQKLNRALRDSADSQHRAGKSLVAGTPRLTMGYWDDNANDDTGLREMEAGIEFDLWRWGQKSNARQLADSLSDKAETWQTYVRLTIAGEVRSSLHQLATAHAKADHAQSAFTDAEALLRASRKLLDTGAISRNAFLQSEALVLEARQHLLDEKSELIDAERNYAMLTGLPLRPATFSEEPPAHAAISPQHPHLRFLMARHRQQAALVERERFTAGGNTTVSIGTRRERSSALEPEIDSFGIAVSIPFGGGSHRRASASAAAVALTEIDVELQNTRRQLAMQLHEQQHQLEVVNESIIYAEKSRSLTKDRWRMTRKAFELGESDIQPTILALRQYRESQLQLQLLKLRKAALASSLKQTIGELP